LFFASDSRDNLENDLENNSKDDLEVETRDKIVDEAINEFR